MDNDYDAADELERDVWEAIQRAKAGKATDADWALVEWAAGFGAPHVTRTFQFGADGLPTL